MNRATRLVTMAGVALVLLAKAAPSPAQAPRGETERRNLVAYGELLNTDLRAERVAVITEVMGFTDAEDRAFWRIYRDYERDLDKLNDERLAGIQEFTKKVDNLGDADADRLAKRALELEGQRYELKKAFYERLRAALPAKTAVRYLQVETQLLLLTDLQIASSLPVVK